MIITFVDDVDEIIELKIAVHKIIWNEKFKCSLLFLAY